MYSPTYNRIEDRAELIAFMRANNFPILVTGTGGVLHASHLPVTVHEEGPQVVIDMHMSKSNLQWHEFFEGEMSDEVMVIFTGPHAYISPRWYEEQERVPTWNYAAVHAYGVARMITDKKVKSESQRRLIESLDPEWLPKFDALRREYVDMMLDGIVNFSIPAARIETRWKLSQNRGRREMELIAAQLDKSADSGARALAALTRKHFVEK
jgi:transcriptional regulator